MGGETLRTAAIVVVLLAPWLLAHGAEAGHTPSGVPYVMGTGSGIAGGATHLVICQKPPGVVPTPVGIGGGCTLTIPTPGALTITVTKVGLGPATFWYEGEFASGTFCGWSGMGTSPLTFAMPAFCDHVTVFPVVGSVAGTITVN